MKPAYLIVLITLAALATAGCSGNSCKNLSGSATGDYDVCSYDRVLIQRQESGGEPIAMIVSFVRDFSDGVEIPIKIIVNWPVVAGEEKDIVNDGLMSHIVNGGAQFPALERGTIKFNSLGDVGGSASGEFFTTFVDAKGTLNGEFSGTVQLLTTE